MNEILYPRDFRRDHGVLCLQELARYLRVVDPEDVEELITDVGLVLESGIGATELGGGVA